MSHDLEKFDSNADKLSVFRERVGIADVLELGARNSRRKARNIGIYNRVIREEREAKLQYLFSALLINTCLLAQVVFASALTALGAGHGSHTQITILGAANTVIAAVLTFTKGQGLPNRLRQYQCSLRKIREHIEQREREFAQSDCRLDVDVEMLRIMEMYEEIRQNDENNDPSTYHASTSLRASAAKGQDLPVDRVQDIPLSSRLKRGISRDSMRAARQDSKEEPNMIRPTAVEGHEDRAPKGAPENDERWNIAYSVANHMLSGGATVHTRDRVLHAEDLPARYKSNTPVTADNARVKSRHDLSQVEEEDITSAQPGHEVRRLSSID
ncbi:hypothetical protein ACLMJK_000892 [Lecanora helva]